MAESRRESNEVARVAARELPEYQRPLIAAHLKFLEDAYTFFASLRTAFVYEDGHLRFGTLMPYVLFVKLLQLGRAVHRLVEQGYAEEAEPVARAMVSAGLNILAIADADTDRRALRFAEFSTRLRARLADGYVAEGYMTQEQVAAIETAERERLETAMRAYADRGITPAGLGAGTANWHGLSDQELATRMNATRWYNLYYRNFSDEGHANALAVTRAIRMLLEERKVLIGPSFVDPWMVVMASVDVIGESLAQVDSIFRMGRRAHVDRMNAEMAEALKTHRTAMPDAGKHVQAAE